MKKLLIIDCNTKHLSEIKYMVSDYFSEVEVISEKDFSGNTTADFVFISGASHVPSAMYHPEKHRIILDFIKNTDKPILGICFGCELIARAYDCELFDSGVKNVETQDICFDDKKYCFPAFEAHRFGIQKVSSQVQVIAHGQNESIEVIQHESKPIIGTQFHPEVSKNSREIFVHLLSKLKI